MRFKSKNRIADVIKMRHLSFVENDAVLEFARVAHDDAIADDDILAHVAAAADLAVLADPGRSFQNRALFDNRAAADEHIAADERATDELAEHRRFQTKLQITRDLFERVPDIALVFEQFRVGRVFEIEELCGRKHFVKRRRVALSSVRPWYRALPSPAHSTCRAIHRFFENLLQASLAPALWRVVPLPPESSLRRACQ